MEAGAPASESHSAAAGAGAAGSGGGEGGGHGGPASRGHGGRGRSMAFDESEREEAEAAGRAMLMSLPGVSHHNATALMDAAGSVSGLCGMSEGELGAVMGVANAKLLYTFVRQSGAEALAK